MPGDVSGTVGVNTPDPDYGEIAAGSVAGTLCKSDFDRRKKKRYLEKDNVIFATD